MYRLLALDLDGTLLRRDHTVDERDIAAIAELQRAGVTVTIITGRLHSGAVDAARACSIEGAIACVEGSHIIELASSTTLHHHPIAPPTAALLRNTLVDHGLTSFVFDAHGIHHDHAGAPYSQYISTWSKNLKLVEEPAAWETEPLCVVAIGDEAQITQAATQLQAHAAELFSVNFAVWTIAGKHALLARAAGPSKGTALRELTARIGCTVDDAVVVGDWMNDVPMFEVAGRSFVMGGVPDTVASRASDRLTSETGTGGGIAEAIRRAWG